VKLHLCDKKLAVEVASKQRECRSVPEGMPRFITLHC